LRLPDFDYSRPGAYFITICTRNRRCLFGEILEGEMKLSQTGETVASCWSSIPNHSKDILLDAFVIMPNHVHGILLFTDDVGAVACPAPVRACPHPTERRGFVQIRSQQANWGHHLAA
jgi:REP element-mobilizing transposase RayT